MNKDFYDAVFNLLFKDEKKSSTKEDKKTVGDKVITKNGCFNNDMGISKIDLYHRVVCFCPLGNQNATYELHIEFIPDKLIPDYCVIQKKLDSYTEQVFTMEHFVEEVFKFLTEMFAPNYIKISNYCEDAAHFPARVEKERVKYINPILGTEEYI